MTEKRGVMDDVMLYRNGGVVEEYGRENGPGGQYLFLYKRIYKRMYKRMYKRLWLCSIVYELINNGHRCYPFRLEA